MSTVEPDPERGRAVAASLKALGVKGILITAAEQDYITELACKMPKCFCPEELGGACYFEPVAESSDWEPTHEHFPHAKRDGGHRTVDNSVLAHRLCNRIDHSIRVGCSHTRDLERIRKAREEAIRRNKGRSVALRPMEDEDFVAWLPLLREDYAQDLVRDYGMSADKARAKAVAEIDGHRPAGHSVFVIEVDGKPAGHLWLVERRDAYEPTLVVYDIDVDEPYRGRGYGKAAMVFAEEETRRRGLTRIALHVGARNDVARNLYRSLGFEENEVAMSKPI